MNETITQVLEVYRLVAQMQYSRDEALAEIGEKNSIEPSALLSACAQYLNISTQNFDSFLDPKNAFNFKNFLIRRFPEHRAVITRFFNTFEDTSDIPILDFSKIIKPSSAPPGKKIVNNQGMLSSLKYSFQDWIARNDLPQDIREELKDWVLRIEDTDH